MIQQLIGSGASIILGTNAVAFIFVWKGKPYPEISKVLSGLGLAIALIGFAF